MLRINVTITPRLLDDLDQEGEDLEINRSELLRRILAERYSEARKNNESHYD